MLARRPEYIFEDFPVGGERDSSSLAERYSSAAFIAAAAYSEAFDRLLCCDNLDLEVLLSAPRASEEIGKDLKGDTGCRDCRTESAALRATVGSFGPNVTGLMALS